jgi:hypothetical protein
VLPKTKNKKQKILYETNLGRGTTACKLLVFYAVCRILFDQEEEISFLSIQILQDAVTKDKFMKDSSLCPTTELWNYAFICTEFCIKNKNSHHQCVINVENKGFVL